jgi:hypothetical protein
MCAAVMMSEIGGVFPTGFVATQHTVVGCWPDDVRGFLLLLWTVTADGKNYCGAEGVASFSHRNH